MKFSNISQILFVLLCSVDGVAAFAPRLASPLTSSPTSTRTKSKSTITKLFSESEKLEDPTAKLYNYSLEQLAKKEIDDVQVEALLSQFGERSRAYRRDIFTASDWVRTRRSDRFIENLFTINKSALLWSVGFELNCIAAFSALVVAYNDLLVEGWTDFGGVKHDAFVNFLPGIQLPMVPFTLSVASLGLLLTFRTNVSYARWNEARTAWGKVINDSRSIARMGCIWARSYNNVDDEALQRLGEAICSFSRSLMNRTLSPQEDGENFKKYTEERITDQRYAGMLRDAKHKPTAALAELSQIMVDYELNPIHQVEVDRIISGLCDALGASERIFTSPVPTFYTRHTARFLAVWMFSLPLGLYGPFASTWNHLAMIPTCVVLGGFLLGIEQLATQMEEPFSILPMEKMCEGSIRTPVMEQVERSKIGNYQPEGVDPVSTYTQDTYPPPKMQTAQFEASAAASAEPVYVASEPSDVAQAVEDLNKQWARMSGSSS
jgi:predicted membrane chloride channel (bestrophin family)